MLLRYQFLSFPSLFLLIITTTPTFFRPNYRPVFNLFMTYELRRTDWRCDEHRTVARRTLKIKLDYRVANSDGLLPPISRFLGHSAMMSASFTGSLHSSPLALCGSPNMSTFRKLFGLLSIGDSHGL